MKKSFAIAAAGATAAAALCVWALSPGRREDPTSPQILSEASAEPVREERTLEVAAAPQQTAATKAPKDYVPATDYARPEDVPWSVFKNKKHALTLRPNRVLEDGTIEYRDVPAMQMGKRTFVTMTAKPTDIAPIAPDEMPEQPAEETGAGSRAPVAIPASPGGPASSPQKQGQ